MIVDKILGDNQRLSTGRSRQSVDDLHQAQQTIYDFLLKIVKEHPPEEVLGKFKQLFIRPDETLSSEKLSALSVIVLANNELEFRNTLKRCCYILVNNWEVLRQHQAVQALVRLFSDPIIRRNTLSPTLKRHRQWLIHFIESKDFQDLELFVFKFSTAKKTGRWSTRYTSYLLAPQYIDSGNPVEQRDAARTLAKRLKERFKFDLAVYTAHSQAANSTLAVSHHRNPKNPTALGEDALRLIKTLVAKRGQFSYRNLAHLFLQQTKQLSYAGFKKSLLEYLIFSENQQGFVNVIKLKLAEKLENLYQKHSQAEINRSLILRTCNRMIDCLTTEDQKKPSPLFTLLLSQGNSLTLAIVLLKIILISRSSHLYLEARIADLIGYYEQYPEEQCDWIINFLEIFSVTFAIYAENIEYNLVKVVEDEADHALNQAEIDSFKDEDIEACRIFSQTIRP